MVNLNLQMAMANSSKCPFFIDFYVHIEEVTDVMISVRPYDEYGILEPETCGFQLSTLKGWSVQLQGGYYND